MKKILFLTTGGTIASSESEVGLVPSLTSSELLGYLGTHQQEALVECEDLLHLDSSNVQPEEWILIARRIAKAIKDYDGIVVTHGTDTLAYTASALSFMLENLPVPVIMTGSQLPLEHPLSDGVDNIRCSFAAALQDGLKGVYVCFNRQLILGTRAVKVRTMNLNAFESVNVEPAAILNAKGMEFHEDLLIRSKKEFHLADTLCKKVFLLKLTPGLNPEIFDMLSYMGYKGIVIEAFGAGGMHFERRDLVSKLEEMAKQGISVVACSQCLYEHSDFTIYQTGQKVLQQGVIPAWDMTSEAALAKLMWALGKTTDREEVKKLFETNFVNEITLI